MDAAPGTSLSPGWHYLQDVSDDLEAARRTQGAAPRMPDPVRKEADFCQPPEDPDVLV